MSSSLPRKIPLILAIYLGLHKILKLQIAVRLHRRATLLNERVDLHMLRMPGVVAKMLLCLANRLFLLFIVWGVFFLLTGCAEGTLVHQIDRAEQKWNTRGISNYSIQVQAGGWWRLQNYTVVVRGGEVVSYFATYTLAPADSEPCDVYSFNAEGFTVPGLFATARAQVGEYTTITFDPDYGFPLTILSDHPQLADEEQVWTLLEFSTEIP